MQVPPVQNQAFSAQDAQAMQDDEQLRILSILKLVYGIFVLCLGGIALVYFLLIGGIFAFTMSAPSTPGRGDPGLGFAGGMFMAIGLVVFLVIATLGGLALYSSKCIRERRNWNIVMVSGAINCLHMPLGTALGIYTMIVISKPSIRAQFTS